MCFAFMLPGNKYSSISSTVHPICLRAHATKQKTSFHWSARDLQLRPGLTGSLEGGMHFNLKKCEQFLPGTAKSADHIQLVTQSNKIIWISLHKSEEKAVFLFLHRWILIQPAMKSDSLTWRLCTSEDNQHEAADITLQNNTFSDDITICLTQRPNATASFVLPPTTDRSV